MLQIFGGSILRGIACLCAGLFCMCLVQAQTADSVTGNLANIPSRFFKKIQAKTAGLDQQLTRQTEKYLQRLARREERLKKKLYALDSNAVRNFPAVSPQQQYAALAQRLKSDTGGRAGGVSGEYLAHLDTLSVGLSFLQKNPQLASQAGLSAAAQAHLQDVKGQLQGLQAKMQDAGQIRELMVQRQEQIKQYLIRYTNLPAGISKEYQGLNQDLYYYTQQVDQYKQLLNDPDKMEKKALSMLDQLPAFQQFMKNNSQLATMFGIPGASGTAQSLAGLQTREQLQQMVQTQLAGGGPNAVATLQQNIESAQSQLDQYKDKLSNLGAGGANVDAPNFKPNDQKKKSFLGRLELGVDLQTTRTNFYPTTTDLGLSLGYRLNNNNTIGIGSSYKIGWGTGFDHIALSSQGVGLRSFVDIKIKSGFSVSGGFEYNYQRPFVSLQQIRSFSDWTKSGLIGISKTVSVKNRVLKKTRLQLLWDFLSYQQVPKTQPFLFRIGYGF